MRKRTAIMLALVSGLAAAFFMVPLAMWLSIVTDRCDTTKHVCDVAPLGGLVIGVCLAPFVGTVLGVWAYRRMCRGHRAPAV